MTATKNYLTPPQEYKGFTIYWSWSTKSTPEKAGFYFDKGIGTTAFGPYKTVTDAKKAIDAPVLKTDSDVKAAGLVVKPAVVKDTGKLVKVAVNPATNKPVAVAPVETRPSGVMVAYALGIVALAFLL